VSEDVGPVEDDVATVVCSGLLRVTNKHKLGPLFLFLGIKDIKAKKVRQGLFIFASKEMCSLSAQASSE
jgi:hypothetical protein